MSLFSIVKLDLYDTYARHLIVKAGPLKIDLSYVDLKDEGCDNKLARAILSWGDENRLVEAGVTRDHLMLVDQSFYTTRWYPTGRSYGWSWTGREGTKVEA